MGLRKREKASKCGVIAQLVEHLVRNEKVRGSNPLGSTIFSINNLRQVGWAAEIVSKTKFKFVHPCSVKVGSARLLMFDRVLSNTVGYNRRPYQIGPGLCVVCI